MRSKKQKVVPEMTRVEALQLLRETLGFAANGEEIAVAILRAATYYAEQRQEAFTYTCEYGCLTLDLRNGVDFRASLRLRKD